MWTGCSPGTICRAWKSSQHCCPSWVRSTPVRWSVSVVAEGDREVTHEEVVQLADEVAGSGGIASGIGTPSYGAQLLVEAEDRDAAMQLGTDLFIAAAERAGLPQWPITHTEAINEDEDEMDDLR